MKGSLVVASSELSPDQATLVAALILGSGHTQPYPTAMKLNPFKLMDYSANAIQIH